MLIALAALVALDVLALAAGHDRRELELYALHERKRRAPRDEIDRLLGRG